MSLLGTLLSPDLHTRWAWWDQQAPGKSQDIPCILKGMTIKRWGSGVKKIKTKNGCQSLFLQNGLDT